MGLKVRANPSNRSALATAILMAIPPDVKGETVKLTRKGGIWDDMKRTLSFQNAELKPGQLMEIQAMFDYYDTKSSSTILPKFPILVRCDTQHDQFSEVEITATVDVRLARSVRILHRKV